MVFSFCSKSVNPTPESPTASSSPSGISSATNSSPIRKKPTTGKTVPGSKQISRSHPTTPRAIPNAPSPGSSNPPPSSRCWNAYHSIKFSQPATDSKSSRNQPTPREQSSIRTNFRSRPSAIHPSDPKIPSSQNLPDHRRRLHARQLLVQPLGTEGEPLEIHT